MRFSFKIFLAFFLLIGIGATLFFSSFMTELKPGFRKASEESLVDIANLLAEIAAKEVGTGDINNGLFSSAVQHFQQRQLNAHIWSHTKHKSGLQIYITNVTGQVIYDSEKKNLGADFSQWNDVYRTLKGKYGARSSLADPKNPLSTVMHVAAPIYSNNHLIGVLTVKKPNISVEPFLHAAQTNLKQKGFAVLIFALLIGIVLSHWLSKSIRLLADYANSVRRGGNIQPPLIYGKELSQLALAMSSMKTRLDGTRYVEQYIHTLTHQLKTPISSIIGATELLTEDMPKNQQRLFIKNIHDESNKLQLIVQHMLSLAEIENRDSLGTIQSINLKILLEKVIQGFSKNIQNKLLQITINDEGETSIKGDLFLVEQALVNLIDNAISFSPKQGSISMTIEQQKNTVLVNIEDEGEGIPHYAIENIFERFYSLPRSGEKLKSTGLGLCFVKEIARLHGGNIKLLNKEPHGVLAILKLSKINTPFRAALVSNDSG